MPKGVPNRKYTAEFKKTVIEAMQQEHLSYMETAERFGLRHKRVQGLEGFLMERRGRGSKGRPSKLPKQVEEDLLTEVQRLRAENAYLKNLQALVLEDERRRHKKRW